MIKIDFEIEHGTYGVYKDALYLPEDHGMSEDEIEIIKQNRYTNWLSIVENANQQQEDTVNTIEINGVLYQKVE